MTAFKRLILFILMMPACIYAMMEQANDAIKKEEKIEEFLCCIPLNGDAAKSIGLWEATDIVGDIVFRNYSTSDLDSDEAKKLQGAMVQFSKCNICFSYCWPLPSECEKCYMKVCKKCLKKNKNKCAGACQGSTHYQESLYAANVFFTTAELARLNPGEELSGKCTVCQYHIPLAKFPEHTKNCFINHLPVSKRLKTLEHVDFDNYWKQLVAAAGLSLIDTEIKCTDSHCGFKVSNDHLIEKIKLLEEMNDETAPFLILHMDKADSCSLMSRLAEIYGRASFAFFSFKARMRSMAFSDFKDYYLDKDLEEIKQKYKKDHEGSFDNAQDAEEKANTFVSQSLAKKLAHTGLFLERGGVRCITCKLASVDIMKGLRKQLSVPKIHAGSQPECSLVKLMYPAALIKAAQQIWAKNVGDAQNFCHRTERIRQMLTRRLEDDLNRGLEDHLAAVIEAEAVRSLRGEASEGIVNPSHF